MSMQTIECKSEQDAREIISHLNPNWTTDYITFPEQGLRGLMVMGDDSLIQAIYRWPIFGRMLTPDVQRVTPEELLEFIQVEPRGMLFRCDDPKRLLIGFLSFSQAAQGKSLLRQISLRQYREQDPELRQKLDALRKETPELSRTPPMCGGAF